MSEAITWMLVGVVAAAYIRQRHKAAEKKPTTGAPDQQELDPTRWAHDGSQPAHYGTWDGNALHRADAEVLVLRTALAF